MRHTHVPSTSRRPVRCANCSGSKVCCPPTSATKWSRGGIYRHFRANSRSHGPNSPKMPPFTPCFPSSTQMLKSVSLIVDERLQGNRTGTIQRCAASLIARQCSESTGNTCGFQGSARFAQSRGPFDKPARPIIPVLQHRQLADQEIGLDCAR